MGPGSTGTVGENAERDALRFLVCEGLIPVTRNFRCRGGEIDLIMLHGDYLIFVEVRYRKTSRYSSPALTIDSRKQRKIIRTAAMFLSGRRRFARHIVRFDVVAITGNVENEVEWIQDAFRPQNSTL